jgi:predicted nucleic-acid-binding Zn-ribbon protein
MFYLYGNSIGDQSKEERFKFIMQNQGQEHCSKCGGKRIKVKISGFGGKGGVTLVNPSKGGIFATNNISDIDAFTCINCGYTELYAANLQNLLPKES